MIQTWGAQEEMEAESTTNELASDIHRALIAMRRLSDRQSSSPLHGREKTADARSNESDTSDAWLDEQEFVAAEEPDDAVWWHDDTIECMQDSAIPEQSDAPEPTTPKQEKRTSQVFSRKVVASTESEPDSAVAPRPSKSSASAEVRQDGQRARVQRAIEYDDAVDLGWEFARHENNDAGDSNARADVSIVDEPAEETAASMAYQDVRIEPGCENYEESVAAGDDDASPESSDVWDISAAQGLSEEQEPWVSVPGTPYVPLDSLGDPEDEQPANDWSKRRRISQEEDARRCAMEIARAVGWGEDGLEALEWVLQPFRAFGLVRKNLKDLIKYEGVALDELRLCAQIRTIWSERGFCRGWVFSKTGAGLRPVDWRLNIAWWTALDLARTLDTDDIEEIRLFLESCFEDWERILPRVANRDLSLIDARSPERAALMNFHGYVSFVLDHMRRQGDSASRMPPHLDYQLFPREEGIRDCSSDRCDPVWELFRDE